MQIIVLGMHRSGTSAVTGLLVMAGAYAGPEAALLPAGEDNVKGYWERRDVTELNGAILAAAGADWSHVAGFDPERLRGAEFAPLKKRARQILRKLEPHRPWVMKDPRLCLVLPLWRELLQAPICVLMHRPPLEVARSLGKRDGFALPFGAALWEKYTRESLRASEGLRRILVPYQDLMARPVETARKLFDDLAAKGVRGLRQLDEEALRQFLDPALHRERGDPDAEERSVLSGGQLSLLESLNDGSALGRLAGELSPEARGALLEFEAAGRADAPLEHARLIWMELAVIRELLKAGEFEAAKRRWAQATQSGRADRSLLRLRLETMRELLQAGEVEEAELQLTRALMSAWWERDLWRVKGAVFRRGFSDRHSRRVLRRALRSLKRREREAARA